MKRRWVVVVIGALLIVTGSLLSPVQSAPEQQNEGRPMITLENAGDVEELWRLEGEDSPIFHLDFDANSQLVAGGSTDGSGWVWDVETGKEKYLLEDQGDFVAGVAFTYFESDGAIHLMTAGGDNHLFEYDMADGRLVREHGDREADPPEIIWTGTSLVAFSGDGFKLALSSSDGVEVWDGLVLHYYPADEASMPVVMAWSGDSSLLAALTVDHTIDFYVFNSVKENYDLAYQISDVDVDVNLNVTMALDDRGVTAAVVDDLTSDILIYYLESDPGPRLSGHAPNDDLSLGINGLAFSPDGRLLVSASHDHSLRFWDLLAGEEVAMIETDGEGLVSVAFSPDGQYIATGDLNGDIQIWGVPMP